MRRKPIAVVSARLNRADPSPGNPWRPGILLRPLLQDGQLRGEAGQPVRYRRSRVGVEVVVGGAHLVRQVPAEWVIVYHADYSPSRVFTMLTHKRRTLGTLGSDKSSCRLAWNVAREFPDHPLHEELVYLACELAEACESNGPGRYPYTRFLMAQYLRLYPRGRHRDRLEWMAARLSVRREHGRDPLGALETMRRFLTAHPKSSRRAEIKLAMARLYRIASEWLNSTGGSARQADRFRRRARHLYRALCENVDLEVSQTAQVGLFELEPVD